MKQNEGSDFLDPDKMKIFASHNEAIRTSISIKDWNFYEEQNCVVHHSRLKIFLVYLLFVSFLTLISLRYPIIGIILGSFCLFSSFRLYRGKNAFLQHFEGFIENFIFREIGENHIFWKHNRLYDNDIYQKENIDIQKIQVPTFVFLFSKTKMQSMNKWIHLSIPIVGLFMPICLYFNLNFHVVGFFISTFLISLILLLVYDKREFPGRNEENFVLIQDMIDSHLNSEHSPTPHNPNYQKPPYNIVIGIIESGIFFHGFKTFLNSYETFFPKDHTVYFLCEHSKNPLQMSRSIKPSEICNQIVEQAFDKEIHILEILDQSTKFIHDYFVDKNLAVYVVEGNMMQTEFQTFFEHAKQIASSIEIIEEQEIIEKQEIIEEQDNVEPASDTLNKVPE